VARTVVLRLLALALVSAALVVGSAPPGPALATGTSTVAVDTGPSDVGWYPSLALDASENPVVSYYDSTNGDLKILHCNDAYCAGGDESITAPVTAGDTGLYTSLALDGSGYPVVSYYDASDFHLKILHCNDPDCAGGDDIPTTPDAFGFGGSWTSLALDSGGNPVVSYQVASNDLKILHCNDPACTGGDESITSPDTAGDTGYYSSLALDASGNPVVSYASLGFYFTLMLLHCNDPNCAGGDESVTAAAGAGAASVGINTSLELDGDGNPVVSHFFSDGITETSYADLHLMHCDNPDCTGTGNQHVAPETSGLVGITSSLELDALGNPVVSYYDSLNNDLKLLHCNDANCTGEDETMIWPDTGASGGFSSLALDGSGMPVIGYWGDGDLKVFRCTTLACNDKPLAADSDGDGCTDAQELGTNEELGGRRNPLNPYDFYDTDGNGTVDLFIDIFAVAGAYGALYGAPSGYDISLDRGPPYGEDVWDLRGADGLIDLFTDIFGVAFQFGHTCG
jgi:hypothetical protein